MEVVIRDIKHAFRAFRKAPLFVLTATLVLTLGIGSSVMIFTVINTVILKPLSFSDPGTLVQIIHTGPNGEPATSSGSPAKFTLWRELTDVIDDVTAYRNIALSSTGSDVPEQVSASQVSEAYFRTFRVPLALGRTFSAEDDMPGSPKTTVVSHEYWVARLGADPGIIGTTLSLSGDNYTIIGVTASDFEPRELGDIEVWVPFQLEPDSTNDGESLKVAARLKPGISLEQAQARLASSIAAYRDRFPDSALREDVGFGAVLFQDAVIGTGSTTLFRNSPLRMLWLVFGSVTLLLLIACANVASLMLIRARARDQEMAVRAALGAGRWRIARQLMTESAVLAVVGGILGLCLGYVGIRALLVIDSADLPRLGEAGTWISMDWRVVGFAIALTGATSMLFGLLPALAASRRDMNAAIKRSGTRSGTGFRESRSRAALVVVEMGLAAILLVGAALLIRTTLALSHVDPGFNIDDVIVMRTSLSDDRFHASSAIQALSTNTVDGIRAIPGVRSASASCCIPLQRSWGTLFKISGRDDEGRPYTSGADVTISMGDYFDVFEIPVVQGRVFDYQDTSEAPPVVVVNRAFAERWWPSGQDPLVGRLSILSEGDASPGSEFVREVIGVVENVRKTSLEEVRPTMYVPLAQADDDWLGTVLESESVAWLIRADIDPMQLAESVRAVVSRATGLPVTGVQSMREIVSESISRERANMVLMTIFGAIALLMAATGVYGLVAYSVQQRAQEIGIRMALGAQRDRIVSMVIRQGMLLVGVGTVVGLVAALFLSSLLASVLFGVEPRDVAVFVTVPLILLLVGLLAVSIPAWRASRASPLDILRCG